MRVSITEAAPPTGVEVDLWGTLFEVVPITRSVQSKMEMLEQRVLEFEQGPDESIADANDRFVALQADLLDCHVKPIGKARKKASTVLLEQWRAEKLTLDQLVAFRARLAEAVRPS